MISHSRGFLSPLQSRKGGRHACMGEECVPIKDCPRLFLLLFE